jgi:hypothetical protein
MTAKNHLADVNPENHPILRNHLSTFMTAAVICLAAMILPLAKAQTFQVLHSFTGKGGGTESYAGVTLDRAGMFTELRSWAVSTMPRNVQARVAELHTNLIRRGRRPLSTVSRDGVAAHVPLQDWCGTKWEISMGILS